MVLGTHRVAASRQRGSNGLVARLVALSPLFFCLVAMSQQPSASQSSMLSQLSDVSPYDRLVYQQARTSLLEMGDSLATVSDRHAALEWAEDFVAGYVRGCLFVPLRVR